MAEFVKACRKRSGLSQKKFAEAVGVKNRESVSEWETGRSNPIMKNLLQMIDVARVTIDDCLTFPPVDVVLTRKEEEAEAKRLLDLVLRSRPDRKSVIDLLRALSEKTSANQLPKRKGRARKK